MSLLDDLPDDIDVLKAIILQKEEENARLEALVAAFKQARFGHKSEKIDVDQYEFALEDIETSTAIVEAEKDAHEKKASREKPKPHKKTERASLPKHLPRIEEVIEPDNTTCSCGCERHVIGEDVSERLDIIPTQFRVIVTRRPKYACRSCENGITQAPAKSRLIEGGLPTEGTVANVIISKYADHLPLYRQTQIFKRQGVDVHRSTLATWVGKAAYELTPIYECLREHIKQSSKLFMDETPAPILDPGRGKVKTGYFWALARDDRPWHGMAPPAVAFTYASGRAGQYAREILQGFEGILQVDGYAGYNQLDHSIKLAYCWAHARRKLYELTLNNAAPIAHEGLKQIAKFYKIEAEIKGQSAEQRLAIRQAETKPLMKEFEAWLTHARDQISVKSPTGRALKYIARYWDGLVLFVDDGRIEIDNNTVERTIRPIALNRKNALFAGHETGGQNWAMLASLIGTCKLNNIEPQQYIQGALTAIVNGHKQNDIEQLLPWNF